MSILRTLIDAAIGEVLAEHPKYFTPKGQEKARAVIVRKVLAAFREGGDKNADEAGPPTAESAFVFAEATSREARGYINLRRIAGAVPPKSLADGQVAINRAAYRESVFALADLAPIECWPFLTDIRQIEAWREFFRGALPELPLRSIAQTRDGASGILMPGYWPPSATGRMYDTPGAVA